MRITADTNVLLRLFVGDDPAQSHVSVETLEGADSVAISLQSLCELAWVLGRQYGTARADVAAAIRQLLDTDHVAVDRPAVEAGLAVLEAGGDFADGVIAHDGRWLGGETFVSFDQKAVRILSAGGHSARLLK